jgi:NAD dependent epimerase/dehydratase family enzyme
MSLIIIFGASGYIGSKLLEHTFPNSGVIGLSRHPGHSPFILEYQSEKLKELIVLC